MYIMVHVSKGSMVKMLTNKYHLSQLITCIKNYNFFFNITNFLKSHV